MDQEFSRQSYGYRPGKSAHDAVSSAGANCHKYGWIIDLDIKGFFDNLNHDKMMQLLKLHTQEQWAITSPKTFRKNRSQRELTEHQACRKCDICFTKKEIRDVVSFLSTLK